MFCRAFALTLLILSSYTCMVTAQESIAAKKLDAALAAYDAKEWDTASALLQEMTAENPGNGRFWYLLGTAEYNRKNYRAAIEPYQRAVAVGYNVGTSHYNRACCLALLGEPEAAIDAIDLAIRNGLRNREDLIREDADLASIRDTPAFRARILPVATPTLSREDGWRMDLAYLTSRVAQTHFDPFRFISREEWDREVARISAALPKMKDHEVVVAIMQLVVRVNDGHTVVAGPRAGRYEFHALPVRFYEFEDGLFVRAAHRDYAAIVGQRLVRVGKMPAREALDLVASTVQRDNTQQIRWLAPGYLTRVEVLDALGIVEGLGPVDITVADARGKETQVTVKPVSLAEVGRHSETPRGWVDMNGGASATTPLWLRDPARFFLLEYLEDSGIVYAGFRAVLDDSAETLDQFAARAVALAESRSARALVIDVRTNNGGNNFLARGFVERIQASTTLNDTGRLFVIVGRETFSACQNFCNWLDQRTDAVFVGEPTGSRPNFVGEGNLIRLPYSDLVVNASSRYWQDSVSEDQRHWIAPELAAAMTSDDYRSNHDPALAAIIEYLNGRAQAAATR
jgi:hypothetical protein